MIDNTQKRASFSNKSILVIVFLPALLALLSVGIFMAFTAMWKSAYGIWMMIMMVISAYITMAVPLALIMLFIERNKLAREQNHLLRLEASSTNAQLHTQQFTEFMPADLCKRLGVSPVVLHRLFFPQVLEGDLAINDKLLNFIHHGFAELAQATEVIEKLADSEDQDEQAVKNNRLAFIIEQSVGLMYFIAEQSHGDAPDCKEAYFVKDALADYADLIRAIVAFSMTPAATFDLRPTFALFDDKQYQDWFSRNRDLLASQCRDCARQNPFAEQYHKWG